MSQEETQPTHDAKLKRQKQEQQDTQAGCITFALGSFFCLLIYFTVFSNRSGPKRPVFSEQTLERRAKTALSKLQRGEQIDDLDVLDMSMRQEYTSTPSWLGGFCCMSFFLVLAASLFVGFGGLRRLEGNKNGGDASRIGKEPPPPKDETSA